MLNNCLDTLQIIAALMKRSVDRIDLPILYQNVEVHLQVPLGLSCYRVNQVAPTGLWCTEREFFIVNLLVRIHLIIETV